MTTRSRPGAPRLRSEAADAGIELAAVAELEALVALGAGGREAGQGGGDYGPSSGMFYGNTRTPAP